MVINALHQFLKKNSPSLDNARIAIAVSGGADSMALCLALSELSETYNFQMYALTVDHKLRPESSIEANQVHLWLNKQGIHHETLVWHHNTISSNIQEQARNARYKLLIDYCIRHGIPNLFFGHHLHDQWETFLMRLSHCSGLKGLTSMSSSRERQGIRIFRPFLNTNPNHLKEYLHHCGQPWIEDPSNQSETYERIRFRNKVAILSELGLSPNTIAKTCKKLHLEDEALDWSATSWIQNNTNFHTKLKFVQSHLSLKHLPESLIKRIALRLASQVRGLEITAYETRHNMDALYQKLCSTSFKPFTFGGCYWMEHQENLYIVREWDRCPAELITSSNHSYDHRFKLNNLPIGETVLPIGKNHWPKVKPIFKSSTLPYEVFLSLPFILKNGQVAWCHYEEGL